MLDEGSGDVHGCPGTMVVYELSFAVFWLLDVVIGFRVLQNFDLSIDAQMKSDFLVCWSLSEIVWNNVKTVFDHVAQRDGIRQLKQNIIDGTDVDVLHPMLSHMVEDSSVLHLAVDGAVASGCQGDISFTFNHNFSIVIKGWYSTLWEEDNRIFIIPEVVIGAEVVDNLLMVHLTRHQVPFNERTLFSSTLAHDLVQSGQSVGKESEES